ncbi:ComEC/Rec2-related protein [Brucella sp. NF 2653]|uniref:ComEC/Rec2 family competence protein n=1 Tax=unclassified Brucella TaxID=2632610 RepID=UPI0001B481C5|nr:MULTISPECIES: ComEC/Rec2 family competence protein [unclassified Brucella]EEZ33057.1 DNA uptake protein [Brucella sp. 83/13]EFM63101.1 ComEC/Rec2-related protein [Brucella sp. NF 2653]
MTGIGEAEKANERALVKALPEDVLYSFLPGKRLWPADDYLAPAPSPKPLSLFERLYLAARTAYARLASAAEREVGRGLFFVLFPIFMGAGAVIYFTLAFEPSWTPLLAMLVLIAGVRIVARKHFMAAQLLTLALALQLGLVAGKFETERRATPMLGSDVATRIKGRVVALEYQDNGSWRVTLDLLETEKPKLHFAPQRIRISARDIPASTAIGSGLTGFARLRVPSGPVRPGNYDFSFHAYFNGIGANGFFLGTPKTIRVPPPQTLSAEFSEWIATLRVRVSERIQEVIAGEDGNVAAALIAGARGGISEETNKDLRKAELAHILSISGLHMALAAGVVMLALRSLFALFPGFSMRHPVKKYAAFLSLLSCTFYLAMSGADVAAQRSYVMIAVMLCALFVDRAAISMRNLAIAAIAMIALSPHEILGPSFQMSFSATAALIAAYAWWSERNARKFSRAGRKAGERGFLARMVAPAVATGGTSLVAGLASGIFAAYHFNNTAPLGLVGNVLALPAISILVMPFGVFGLVLMPLQLDWLPLQVMGVGLWAVRHIAAFVASWSPDGNPGAIPGPALVLWTMALLVAVAFTTRLKLLALPLLAAGLAVFLKVPFPDIVVSEDAKLVVVRQQDGSFAVNRDRPSKFTIDNWKSAYLIKKIIEPQKGTKKNTAGSNGGFICEEGVCFVTLRDGRTLSYTADETMGDVACNIGDIAILAISGKGAQCESEQTLVISKRDLALKGTLEIRLEGQLSIASDEADSKPALVPPKLGLEAEQLPNRPAFQYYRDQLTFAVDAPSRPWHLHRLYSRPARGLPDREYKKKLSSSSAASACSASGETQDRCRNGSAQ